MGMHGGRRRVRAFVMVCALLGPTGAARADEDVSYRPVDGGFAVERGGRTLATIKLPGGPIYDLLRIGDVLYVARGESGVAVYDVKTPSQPVLLNTLQTAKAAVKLVGGGGSLMVVVAEYGAVAYDISNPVYPVATRLERALAPLAIALAPAGSPSAGGDGEPGSGAKPSRRARSTEAPNAAEDRAPRTPARVTAMRDGWLYIESTAPLKKGDRFVIVSQGLITVPDPVSGKPLLVPSNKRRGPFVVERVEGGKGAGPLAKGTRTCRSRNTRMAHRADTVPRAICLSNPRCIRSC